MRRFPVTDAADQQWTAILDGRRATIRIRYNVSSDRWSMDLSIDDAPVLHGRRLVLNRNVLAAFDLGVGALFVSAGAKDLPPGRSQLVSGEVRFYHAGEAELAAI